MGQPKQLLLVDGAPLLLRTVRAALSSPAWPIVVVLGNAAEQILPLLARLPVQLVINSKWPEGMGSSITAGLEILDRFSSALDGALIALGDQPHFSALTISALGTAFRGRDEIAAARYSGIVGAPAIFGRSYFPELLTLEPKQGAQYLLRSHAGHVTAVDLPNLAVDLDTPEDYQRFLEAPFSP